MTVMLEGRGLDKLSCRDHGGGEWRDIAIAPTKDLAPIVSVWSDQDGAFLVLAGDALYVSTDGALAAPLLQVDFSRNLGIASKPGDKRPVFRAALQ
jgi:hypothetical protein